MTTQKQPIPDDKQRVLDNAVKTILFEPIVPIHFIILFGSYARGDWVEDGYEEDGITYSYHSDFDLLVITDACSLKKQHTMEAELSHQLSEQLKMPIIMSVNVLVHNIDTVNRHLSQRRFLW